MNKTSCIIAQSGGPTAVINSSLAGIISNDEIKSLFNNVYGSLNGIEGIINFNLIDLLKNDKENIELLKTTPGAILGSARHCLPNNFNDEVYQKIDMTIEKLNVKYLFFIGGNDSMDTVKKLNNYFKSKNIDCKVIGVPKTIDNDISHIDHSPGYGSAIKYIASTMAEIKLDTMCYSKGRVTIVEIMGRDAGWLTAGSKLASLTGYGPDLIYLPESLFDLEDFLCDVSTLYKKNKKVLVAISEGIRNKKNEYVVNEYKYIQDNDVFGHMQLGGTATVLADIVHERLNLPVRALELNLPQRCAAHLASKTDIDEAYNCGYHAVNFAKMNKTGIMVSMRRHDKQAYNIQYVAEDINLIANVVKPFPDSWIKKGNDISKEYIEYAKPLIVGEPQIQYNDGLAKYAKLNMEKIK